MWRRGERSMWLFPTALALEVPMPVFASGRFVDDVMVVASFATPPRSLSLSLSLVRQLLQPIQVCGENVRGETEWEKKDEHLLLLSSLYDHANQSLHILHTNIERTGPCGKRTTSKRTLNIYIYIYKLYILAGARQYTETDTDT